MIEVKIISKPKSTAAGGTIATTGTAGTAYGQESVKDAVHSAEADHAALADEATHAATADEATHAATADEATHAASSATLDSDSPVWNLLKELYLSKVDDDTAAGLITFLKGLALGEDGKYGITAEGAATLASVISGKWGITEEGIATLAGIVAEYLKSKDFKEGYFDGKGFGLYKDTNGNSVMQVEKLFVTLKAVYAELEIRKLSYVGGDQVHSMAGSVLQMVKPLDKDGNEIADGDTTTAVDAYKCYYIDDDGTTRTENWWKTGDMAWCQTFNIEAGVYKDVSNRLYRRLVLRTGSEEVTTGTDADGNAMTKQMGYVVLSNRAHSEPFEMTTDGQYVTSDTAEDDIISYDGTPVIFTGMADIAPQDAPAAEDKIVQIGSQSDPDRGYAYIIYVTEQRRVDYAGISDWDLSSHAVAQYSPKSSFAYSKYFQLRSGDAGSWHPMTNYRGAWASGIEFSYYDAVTYDGLLWMQNKEGYTSVDDEPSPFSEVWTCVSDGGNELRIEFESSKGSVVYVSNVDLTLTARLMFGQKDYTEYLFKDSRSQLSWSRDSGVESEDASWSPTMGDTANILLLTHHKADAGNRKDLGSKWEDTLSCSFTFSADIYYGDTSSSAKKNVSGTVSFDLLG